MITASSPAPIDVPSVEAGRALIDEVDRDIQRLLAHRAQISRAIQALRVAAGEPRVQHQRENEVIAGYRRALGRPGVAVALAALGYCRGDAG
ncbi:MAG TPA: chorismate mutase [Mycobacteriales bacterium]|nr:chorismate mutase [Mycobacteriales bacterium]